jgi:hypothetical protein
MTKKPETIIIPEDDRTRRVTILMYEAGRKNGAAAAERVAYALSDLSNVFELISVGMSSGHYSRDDAGLISIARICAEYTRAMADHEGEHLHRLKMALDNPLPLNGEAEGA